MRSTPRSRKKAAKRPKIPAKRPKISLSKDDLSLIMKLSDLDLKLLYDILGTHLSQIEDPYYAIGSVLETQAAMDLGIRRRVRRVVNVQLKAFRFLKRFWPELLRGVCGWWNKNKDKVGDELVTGLAPQIGDVLPPEYKAANGVITIVAPILIKAGLKRLCREFPAEPPAIIS